MKKSIASIIVFILLMCSIPLNIFAQDNNVKVYGYTVSQGLHTVDSIVSYEGTTEVINYDDMPSEGNEYLLIDMGIEIFQSGQTIDLSNINLEIDGITYNRINDSFISNHGYTPLPQYTVSYGSFDGILTYEIPMDTNLVNASLIYNDRKLNINNTTSKADLDFTNIPKYEDKLTIQSNTDKQLTDLLHSDMYTLDNPFIIQDPYGNYLTAVVLFKTDIDSKVSIEVKGKDEYTTVLYDFPSYEKYHSIPILGLYPDYENTINLYVTDVNGVKSTKTINIKTSLLPDRAPTYKLIESKPEKMADGMTFMAHSEDRSGYSVVDSNGEIRWYMDAHTTSAPFTRLKNGNMLVVSNVDEYPSCSKLYEMDMLGRILKIYNVNETIHHDATEDEDGNLIVPVEQGYKVIDRNTGEIIEEMDLRNILPKSMETNFYNKYGTYDHIHLNTTAPYKNSMVMSSRNQDMILKIERGTNNIEWILAYPENIPDSLQKYMLTPIGDMAYTGGQHDSHIIEDLDGDPNTIELIAYDNHIEVLRGDGTSGDYSRGVIYQINEKDMTVKELWSYGEELGDYYHCQWQGSANYYPDSDTSLMLFNTTSNSAYGIPRKPFSSAIETTMDNEVVFHVDAYGDVDMPTYRAERYPLYPDNWTLDLSLEPTIYGETLSLDTKMEKISDGDYLGYLPDNSINIKEIGIDDNRLYFRGSGKTKDSDLVFFGENTYIADGYNVYGNSFQVNVDYSSLPDGKYTIGILSHDTDGKEYYSSTKYYLNIGETSDFNEFSQKQIDSVMAKEFDKQIINKTPYTASKPLIYLDPYDVSPLTAIGMFQTYEPTKLTVTVRGKTEDADISYTFDTYEKIHKFPIYGLYADYDNTVDLTIEYENGHTASFSSKIKTEPVATNLYNISIEKMDKTQVNNDLFFLEGNQNMAFDKNGDLRWYFSNELANTNGCTPIRQLKNGNIAMFSGKIDKQPYYASSFYELNYLGKIIKEYPVRHGHHDIEELPNGNFLVATSNPNRHTEEDYIEEIDRVTGEVVDSVDIYEILKDPKISNETYQSTSTKEAAMEDWFHLNSFDYVPEDNSIVVSGRQQNFVGKIDYDTKELVWAFTEPFEGMSDETRSKLLTPIDDTAYVYGQHSAEINEEGNLQVYDNGNYQSKSLANAVDAKDNYSRGAVYEIDEENMTIKEIFSYGEDVDYQTFTPYIGDIDYLGPDHYLINFGGLVEMNNEPSDNIMAAMDGSAKSYVRLVEVKNGEEIANIILENDSYSNSYRASKVNIYDNQKELEISNSNNHAVVQNLKKIEME